MEKDSIIRELQKQLQMQNILIECVYTLHANQDLEVAIGKLLSIIAQYYHADRVYVFQFDSQRKWMDNTYEWCREGIPSEKDMQQHLEVSAIGRWFPWFEESGEFVLAFLQEELNKHSGERRRTEPRKNGKLITAPLFYESRLMGFLGVDNPCANADTIFLLQSTARFIVHDLFSNYQ